MTKYDDHKQTEVQVISCGKIVYSDDDFSNGGDFDHYEVIKDELEAGEEARIVKKETGEVLLSHRA